MRTLLSQLWIHQRQSRGENTSLQLPCWSFSSKTAFTSLTSGYYIFLTGKAFAVFLCCLLNRKEALWWCTLVSSSIPMGTPCQDSVLVCLMPSARQDCSCCSAWLAEGKVSGAPSCSGKSASSTLPGAWLHPEDGFLLFGLRPGEGGRVRAQPHVCSNTQRSYMGIWALLGWHCKDEDWRVATALLKVGRKDRCWCLLSGDQR